MNSLLWKQIANYIITKYISEGVPVVFNDTVHAFKHENILLTHEQSEFVDKDIISLLLTGAVEK